MKTTQRDDAYRDALLAMAGKRGLVEQATGGIFDPYDRGGVWAKIVDLPCDKALSCGVEIEGDDEHLVRDELDRLGALHKVAKAMKLARSRGGAALLVLADDSPDLSAPLMPERVQQLRGLRVLAMEDVIPVEGTTDMDPASPTFGQAAVYRLESSYYVHASRLITFCGQEPSRTVLKKAAPWQGLPEVTAAWHALSGLCEGVRLALQIMERKQQAVYGMKGMAELFEAELGDADLQGAAEVQVQRRLELVDRSRGVLNTVAIDAEDQFALNDMQLTGIKDVLGELQVDVSAHSGIPTTLLFGRSPAGQNATGEADFRGFYDMVQGKQQRQAKPALERLVSLIYASRAVSGSAPDSWSIQFSPLMQPTPQEAAAARKADAEADKIRVETVDLLIGRDMIDADTARQYLIDHEVIDPTTSTGAAGAAEYARQQQTS